MNLFISNQLISEADSVAEILKAERTKRSLKLGKIAETLGINEKYLIALENGRFEELPAGIYGKNFLREYALYLGLETGPLIEMFELSLTAEKAQTRTELFSKQVVKSGEMLALPRIFKNIALAAVVLICFIYLSYRLEKIVAPPTLEISNPAANLITKEHSIEIIGRTEPETQIIINGEKVLSDSTGNFLATVNLKTGINMITITAQKKYGRETRLIRQVLVEN
jgi:transcriptional regulator with XRE-family HTH domain